MKIFTLTDKYQIINIEKGGDQVEIRFGQEGINEKDFVFLSDHIDLKENQYEVLKVRQDDEMFCGTLVKVPVKEES